MPATQRRTRAVCAHYGLNAADAEEVFQDVSKKILVATTTPKPGETAIRRFDTAEELVGWAAAVARSLASDVAQRRSRSRTPQAGEGLLDTLPGRRLASDGLTDYLALLADEQHRRVIVLRFEDEMTIRQIAAALGVSVGQAYALLSDAIKILRRRMSE